MNNEVVNLLNNQINEEMNSAFIYLSMSLYFEDLNYRGFAHWMRKQYEEEMEHADRFIKYLQDRGEKPVLKAISAPNQNWTSFAEVFETTLNHEKEVSQMIRRLMKTAISCEDYETQNMLNWFINEQIEEESDATYLLEKFKKVSNNESGIMALDRECAIRA